MAQIILASKSKYRKAQLKAFGYRFRTIAPGVDESKYKSQIKSPRKLAATLAQQKSLAVAKKYPNAIVIGSDQLVALGHTILGKPQSYKRAFQQLKSMAGRRHKLITSVAVTYRGQMRVRTVIANIQMRKYSDREIHAYLKLDKPFDSAGSYKFECAGLSLVQKMQVSDPSALIGLPLIALHALIQSYK